MPESLLCNSCGAPLEVPASANFVKCGHCLTTLKINRSSDAITTESIEKLTETTGNLAEQVEKLTQQNRLADLDRDWESEQQSFMIRDKNGAQHLPAQKFAWVGGVATAFFGGLWTIFAISITQSGPDEGPFGVAKVIFPLFGIGFIAFGIFMSVMVHNKAKAFEHAQQRYRRRRKEIIQGDD